MLKPDEMQPGVVVEFRGEVGYDMELQKGHSLLEIGRPYMVSDVFRDKWGTYIYLEGLPRKSFALSLFADAGDAVPHMETLAPVSKVRKVRAPSPK